MSNSITNDRTAAESSTTAELNSSAPIMPSLMLADVQIKKRERPILGFSCPICNKVFAASALHIDYFNENDHEENARIVKELIEYAAQGLNVAIYQGKDYDFDYCEHVRTRNKQGMSV
jgi:isopropylmalate/homocitrate/citramalate synthase